MPTVDRRPTASAPARNVFSRLALVLTTPTAGYGEIAARPRALGALSVVVAVMMLCQLVFLSTEVGQQVMVDQQLDTMESFGVNITEDMERQVRESATTARFTGPASQLVFVPLITAVVAALLLAVFNVTSERTATFMQVFALLAHAGIVFAIQQVVMTPISYALGEFATVTRATVFLPMLDPDGLIAHLLEPIELFAIWWLVSISIGFGVLYRRPTRSAAIIIVSIYAAVGVAIAVTRTVF